MPMPSKKNLGLFLAGLAVGGFLAMAGQQVPLFKNSGVSQTVQAELKAGGVPQQKLGAAATESARPTENITLTNGLQTLQLNVEVAESQAERAQGLMGRQNLPEGMLFVFPESHRISMWMKDTPQSLDMIFIQNGQVVDVVEHTLPFSETLIVSAQQANMVLEVASGFVAKQGIQAGWVFQRN